MLKKKSWLPEIWHSCLVEKASLWQPLFEYKKENENRYRHCEFKWQKWEESLLHRARYFIFVSKLFSLSLSLSFFLRPKFGVEKRCNVTASSRHGVNRANNIVSMPIFSPYHFCCPLLFSLSYQKDNSSTRHSVSLSVCFSLGRIALLFGTAGTWSWYRKDWQPSRLINPTAGWMGMYLFL